MERRIFLITVATPLLVLADSVRLRGKLSKDAAGGPAMEVAGGKLVPLTGDADTMGVLKDSRLAGADFEVVGRQTGDRFTIDPIHSHALYVYRDGKPKLVTYWCEVCAIRTYTPGLCWCCREETALDPQDPATVEKK